MLSHVLDALKAAGVFDDIRVVSKDPDVLNLAKYHGVSAMQEPESCSGLNDVVGAMLTSASQAGEALAFVCHADLPLVSGKEIAYAVKSLSRDEVILMPNQEHTGTNAMVLYLPNRFTPAFGEDSFRKHCRIARTLGLNPRVISLPDIAFDVDTATDWQRLMQMPSGSALLLVEPL